MTKTRLHLTPLEPRETPTVLPAGFTESLFTTGLSRPTAMAVATDGRVFVVEQGGTLRLVAADGTLQAAPVLALPVDSAGERGLIGVALDPDFGGNGFVYVYHTVPGGGPSPAFNRITRFTVRGGAASPTSGVVVLDLDPLSAATNHNGGGLAFGPDGKLYVGVGDNSNRSFPQSLASRHGKILRINPDGSIPADNPTAFSGVAGSTALQNRAVWAVGLRNPFTLGVQPGTGRVFVNDVGQDTFEEVNEGGPGRNFGWPATEGDFNPAAFPAFTRPLVAYPHQPGIDGGYSVVGGAFYNPVANQFPGGYVGDYFYGDFINRWISRYDPEAGSVTSFASDLSGGFLVDIDVTPQGELLYLGRGEGGDGTAGIYRVGFTQPTTTVTTPVFVGSGPGRPPVVRLANPATGASVREFDPRTAGPPNGFAGEARVASGDVNGDGVVDVIVGSGPGGPSGVVVFDGKTSAPLHALAPFEPAFAGGVFVALGDVTGDGRADLIISPDRGGGPRVRVFDGGTLAPLADFFGIEDPNFRGGARVTAGDVNGDGAADVVLSAGFGGGPRVAGWDGRQLAAGQRVRAFADFFAFEEGLRDGAFVAAGDTDGDDRADVIAGAGPGGGPRVTVYSGDQLLAGQPSPLATFFAGNPSDRGGVRVAARKLDEDATADVITAAGQGASPRVRVYRGSELAAGTEAAAEFDAFETGFTGGVFVA